MGVVKPAKTVFRSTEVCTKVESPFLPQVPFGNRDLQMRGRPPGRADEPPTPLRLAENSAIDCTQLVPRG